MLDRALAQDRRLAQGWLTLAMLDLVEGRYDAARAHCAQAGKHGGFALGLACSGHVLSYVGQAEQSIALLSRIADDAPGIATAFKAWMQGMLAESNERLGRFDAAEPIIERRSRTRPTTTSCWSPTPTCCSIGAARATWCACSPATRMRTLPTCA